MSNAPNCECSEPAIAKVTGSENEKNPGRPYWTCSIRAPAWNPDTPKDELPGCGYFCWADEVGKKRKRSNSGAQPKAAAEKKPRTTWTLKDAKDRIEKLETTIGEMSEILVGVQGNLREISHVIIKEQTENI